MNDLSSAVVAKSDQTNADDLIGRTLRIRIAAVEKKAGEQPVTIHFDGDNGKPWRPCKTTLRVLIAAWGSDGTAFVGRYVTLYRDETVKWAGMQVGGIRISHLSHLGGPLTIVLAESRKSKKPVVVQPDPFEADRLRVEAAKTTAELGALWGNLSIPAQQALARDKDQQKAKLATAKSVKQLEKPSTSEPDPLVADVEMVINGIDELGSPEAVDEVLARHDVRRSEIRAASTKKLSSIMQELARVRTDLLSRSEDELPGDGTLFGADGSPIH